MSFSDNAITILQQRYLRSGETPDGMLRRVAGDNQDYYEMMSRLDFLPNSPTLFNAGSTEGTMSACFVLEVPDSLDGILEVATKAAALLKWGGGVGYVLSHLRSKQELVRSTGGRACGPVRVLKLFHALSATFDQGGKRPGAQMAVLSCDHPDISDFINAKAEDPDALSTFNISVALTDDFMRRAIAQLSPERELWHNMCENAWRTGDPGCFFINAVNRDNPVPWLGRINGCNPCALEGTLVATSAGWRPVEEVQEGDEIGIVGGIGRVRTREVHQRVPVYRVLFSDGGELSVTASHQFHAIKRGVKPSWRWQPLRLDQLSSGDRVRIAPAPMPDRCIPVPYGLSPREFGFAVGLLLGDGSMGPTAVKKQSVCVAVHAQETEWQAAIGDVLSRIAGRGYTLYKSSRNQGAKMSFGRKLTGFVTEAGLVPALAHEKRIPLYLANSNEDVMTGIIDGLFSADGSVEVSSSGPMVRLHSSSLGMLRDIRRMLLCFGIQSGITSAKSTTTIEGRTIRPRGGNVLCICGRGVDVFAERIALSHPAKQSRMEDIARWHTGLGNKWQTTIKSITPAGEGEVYDLYEPDTDTWLTEGYVSVGCGEQPLLDNEACNLGSINLSNFVKDGRVDFQRLSEVVVLAVRFLDSLIDRNNFPHPDITSAAMSTRKIGLGVMGWADMLAKLHIHYDSDEALILAEKLMSHICVVAFAEDVELGRRLGCCPAFVGHNTDGRRNATVLTIAPTGTISLLAGCSSGIEPHFALEWTNTMSTGTVLNDGVPKGDFVPRVAHEIGWEWHVRMQAAFQKYVDAGISKTVNLPNSATVGDVRSAYELMWRLGCKGGTVYRDGCRENQVLKLTVPSSRESQSNGRRRLPRDRNAITHKFVVADQEGYATVGLYEDGRPGELFIKASKEGSTVSGLLDTVSILTSMALQYGVPLSSITQKLSGVRFEPSGRTDNERIPYASSLVDYVFRWLDGRFDGAFVPHLSGEVCSLCGQPTVWQGNCFVCTVCGYNKCGG